MTFLDLAQATDRTQVGGKAAGLAAALVAGVRVPDGVVLPVGAPDPDLRALDSLLGRLGGAVAVRSSGVEEDGTAASFAGQYDTVLGVRTSADLADAIRRCRESAGSTAAVDYGEHFHRNAADVAVLVQRMLEPDVAGAAFAIDPVSGADHVVVEAVAGLGDALLAGAVEGERWEVGHTAHRLHGLGLLDPAAASEIAALCRRLADERGVPVEIEWAIEAEELHLLQVRPITTLLVEPAARPPTGHTYVREPRFDRPIHPLSFSSWLPVHTHVLGALFEEFGVPAHRIESRRYLGRVYGRVVPLAGPSKDGPAPPTTFLRLLMSIVPTMRRRLRRSLDWDGDARILTLIGEWEGHLRSEDIERTLALRAQDLGALSDEDLAAHLGHVRSHVEATAFHHFRLTFGTLYIPTGRLGIFLETHLGWPSHRVVGLLQGHAASSTAHGRAIDRLVEALGPSGVERAIDDPYWLRAQPPALAYLTEHGHRVNGDLTQRTEAEDPGLLADHLRRHRDGMASGRDPRAEAAALAKEAETELGNGDLVAEFRRLLELARRGRPFNDDSEGVVLDALTLIRPIALEAGRRLARRGDLRVEEDVFFLEIEELVQSLHGGTPPPDIERRKAEHRWAQANPAPSHLGPPPAPPPHWKAIPKRFLSTVAAAMWATAAAEAPKAPTSREGDLVGTPGSPGTAAGTARIIRSADDFHKLRAGDVLVCPTSVGAWSPVFGTISGLITEHGGPLSHPATLAREYGLPAVLAVQDATSILKDGDRIEVNGTAGTVEVL